MKNLLKLMALMLLLLMAITACASSNSPDADTTQEVTTEEITTEAVTTEEVTTEEITTEEATTEEIRVEVKKPKNILMIGNSFCYYYVEELSGIARADGYDLVIANLYKSGAPISEHYDSYKTGNKVGELFVTEKRRKNMGSYSFEEALDYAKEKLGADWDVITLQGSSRGALLGDSDADLNSALPYAKELFAYLEEKFPQSELYWHQSWSYEIGYGSDKSEIEKVMTVEKRTSMYEIKKATAYSIASETGVKIVPTGDAWELARANALIGTTLCKRTNVNNNLGDYYHDGDIGGGQYLNACVWYEVLMGESCIGNTWRPTNYELSEEKIAILQVAAHEAVAAVYGADHAK